MSLIAKCRSSVFKERVICFCFLSLVFGLLSSVCFPQEEYVEEEYIADDDSADGAYDDVYLTEDEFSLDLEEEKISLDLKGVDLVEFFKVLSIKTGQTIVPSKNLSGRITIFLNNVTFQDALDVILISQELALDRTGEIIFVMTDSEYKSIYGREYHEKREMQTFKLKYADPANVFTVLDSVKSDVGKIIVDKPSGSIIALDTPEDLKLIAATIKDLDKPRPTAVFDINYSATEDMKTSLDEIITPDVGEVIVDERSSKVFVADLPEKLQEVARMVKAFDEEARQVFVETQIVEITLNDRFQRGVDWERLFNQKNMNGLDFVGEFSTSITAYQQMSVGSMTHEGYVMVLQYLQSNTDIKILSSPLISVVNNQEAKVHIGSREAYVVQTTSQGETTVTSENVEFIDVGVQLDIVPRIGKDGFITMKIKPEISSVRATLTTSIDSEIPLVDTSEVETVVKVKDGTTVMLGGLIKDEDRNTISGNPWLMNLPLVGWIFGSRDRQVRKTETVVFITPRLSSGAMTLAGNEIEKHLPLSIMPEHTKKAVMLRELDRIEIESRKHPAEDLFPSDIFEEKEDLTSEDLQGKIKGPKD